MRISGAVVAIASLLVTVAAGGREIHYGAVTDAALVECDRAAWRGREEEADACYRRVLQGTPSIAIRAEAAWALDDLQAANRLFREAVAASPEDAAVRVRWGDLFAASHQEGEAMNLYREALEIDAGNAYALLGAGRVLADSFDEAANAFLEPLLADATKTDGARAAAWLLVARIGLENSRLSKAAEALDEAEALLTASGWPPLDLYALRAAADLLNNITASRYTVLALDYNPAWGGIYAIPAHFYVITRRYRDAIDLYQKAVDIEPGLASAHEELGINLLRDNQMGRARRHLETAYNEDPFSPQTVNTLRLMDSFANFRLINDPDKPRAGVLPVTLRLHQEEADAIAPYALALARQSIAEFTSRYGFELREPVIIEMYPDHEDFAVRTAGMPGIGILGATFGYVVAMDSPSARPPSQFQWGTTLWHEMAHVFTLEASNHLVPRWFSEGVSVYEEWRSGPNRGVHIPMNVYQAMQDDRFLPVAQLDEGFIRPTYEEQVIVSYMQAGLICQYIDTHFGVHKLGEFLPAFKAGLQTGDAVQAVLGLAPQSFDEGFDEYVRREHGAALAKLDDWQQSYAALGERIEAADWAGVAALAGRLVEIMPNYVEADSPYIALARASEEQGDRARAVATLETFWRNGGYDPDTLQQLARWLVDAGRSDDAINVLQAVNLVDPLSQAVHGELGDLLLSRDRAEDAMREYRVALALDPHDKATAYYRLAKAYHVLGDREASQQQLLLALDVAPNFRPAQRLLLEIMRTGSDDEHQ